MYVKYTQSLQQSLLRIGRNRRKDEDHDADRTMIPWSQSRENDDENLGL